MRATIVRTALVGLVATFAVLGSGSASAEPLGPIPKLDVQRYLGTWNQLAALPQPYNLNCARDTQANYTLDPQGNVTVHNTCTTWQGGKNDILGKATINDKVTNAQLHVSFPDVPFQSDPNGPTNYIVTAIAPDYSWALVGDPNRLSGFVLSRTTALTPQQWKDVRSAIRTAGYNECVFLTSPTPGGLNQIAPLCTLPQ
ncbi:lipocalin family protein [Antrihabitans cavernicola]|uniref:Lipocalin family protein n=1 Tax=Antrihabitans cavernicola TaxID=2495913 RepID=A0A5A7S449_9NOCA|nr:lipocalin family protein [Spelaeibacter cavernicola]KAA0020181.1 lipocalin family protein [Spelaeibacter cavernicola]